MGFAMFSPKVEYALLVMTEIARNAPARTAKTEIQGSTGTPHALLAALLRTLSRLQLTMTRRGPGGGVALARPANEISLLEVIDAIEPLKRSRNGKTALSRKLDAMVSAARKTAAGTTLADVAAKGKR